MKRNFISIGDINKKELLVILNKADTLKKEIKKKGINSPVLNRKTLIMLFEKPSLRTKLSFAISMTQLGGNAVYMGPTEVGLGIREPVKDVAKVSGSMGDIVMARTFKHENIVELAKYCPVPVINALDDFEHPCQTMADLMTIKEIKGHFDGLKIAYIGDCDNNVTRSLAMASEMLGIHFISAGPKGYQLNMEGKFIKQTTSPEIAVKDADVVYTDTWVSMGAEEEKKKRLKIFPPYQVTPALMKLAKRDAIFMHDLPAYRGNEVHADVIDGPQSVIYQQAENRLHAQKAILLFLLNKM